METGGRYVIIFGQPLMPMWPVDNLATLVQVGCNLYCARIWLMQYTHSYLSIFTDATAYSNAHFGHNANIIIALDDLACTTAQTRLIDCTHDTNTGDCSHSDDAGVQCVSSKYFITQKWSINHCHNISA